VAGQFNDLAYQIAKLSGEVAQGGSTFAKLLGKLNRK